MGKRSKHDGSFSPQVRQLIYDRDGGACIICGRPAEQIHHRRPRSSGGTSLEWVCSASNGICLCAEHHAAIESDRLHAKSRGWIIPATWKTTALDTPCFYPVLGLSFFLDEDGAMREAPTDDPNF